MTRGLPPIITCSRTSFSNASMPWCSIILQGMRTAYWKLGVFSTKAARSRSGGMGSNAAFGRCAGMMTTLCSQAEERRSPGNVVSTEIRSRNSMVDQLNGKRAKASPEDCRSKTSQQTQRRQEESD